MPTPTTATNAAHPPRPELRAAPDGAVEIWYADQFIGGIEPEPGALRLILGDADPGSALTLAWTGGPMSFTLDLASGAL